MDNQPVKLVDIEFHTWDYHWHTHRWAFLIITAAFAAFPAYELIVALSPGASSNDTNGGIAGAIVYTLFMSPVYLTWFFINHVDTYKNWQRFIDINGFSRIDSPTHTDGRPFQIGENHRYSDGIAGTISGREFEMFTYTYDTGTDRRPDTHTFTVFTMPLVNPTPEIFAKSLKNRFKISLRTEINAPWPTPDNATYLSFGNDFDKYYKVEIPAGAQVEALQIFEPAMMMRLIQLPHRFDFELFGSTLYIYKPGEITQNDELSSLFSFASLLSGRIEKDIDYMNYQPDLTEQPAFSPRKFAVRFYGDLLVRGLAGATMIAGGIALNIGYAQPFGTPSRIPLAFGGIGAIIFGALVYSFMKWLR